jgi:hypothetical protein
MSAFSDFLENEILDHVFRSSAYSSPETLYVGLFVDEPGDDGDGDGNELTIGTDGYARAVLANNATTFLPATEVADVPTKTNNVDINFPTATGNWAPVSHFAIFDAATGGNMLLHGAFPSARIVATGDSPKILKDAMSLTLANASTGGFTDYLQTKILDHLFGRTNFTPPSAIYFAPGTAHSLATDSFTECIGWSRLSLTFGTAAAAGMVFNSAAATKSNDTPEPQAISSFALFDAVSSGNKLVIGPVSTPQTLAVGDTLTIAAPSGSPGSTGAFIVTLR